MVKMDDIDKDILNILQQNDKISYKEIGQKLNMAPSSIHNRVKNMEKSGLIKSFSAIVDPFKAGLNTVAVLGLSVDVQRLKDVAQILKSYDEVQTVAVTTGGHDMIAQVIARDEKELWRFINKKVKTIEGVRSQMDVSSFIDTCKMTHFINFKSEKLT